MTRLANQMILPTLSGGAEVIGMNSGLLFGEVYCSNGPVEGATVTIDWLKGDLSMPAIKVQLTEKENENVRVSTETNSNGKYVLPFFWDGTQIASALSTKTLTMRTYAFKSDTDKKKVKAHLCLDLRKLFSVAFPTFDKLLIARRTLF